MVALRAAAQQQQEQQPEALVDELMGEIERLQQEKADAEAQADELASSLSAERRRSEQQVREKASETLQLGRLRIYLN